MIKNIFRNLKNYKPLLATLILNIVFILFFTLFLPVMAVAISAFSLGYDLNTYIMYFIILIIATALILALLYIIRATAWLLIDLSKDLKLQSLKISSKKIRRTRKSISYHLAFYDLDGWHVYMGNGYSFNKLRRGESYQLMHFKKSKFVSPEPKSR